MRLDEWLDREIADANDDLYLLGLPSPMSAVLEAELRRKLRGTLQGQMLAFNDAVSEMGRTIADAIRRGRR